MVNGENIFWAHRNMRHTHERVYGAAYNTARCDSMPDILTQFVMRQSSPSTEAGDIVPDQDSAPRSKSSQSSKFRPHFVGLQKCSSGSRLSTHVYISHLGRIAIVTLTCSHPLVRAACSHPHHEGQDVSRLPSAWPTPWQRLLSVSSKPNNCSPV